MPRIDLDTVTFESGSWELSPDQIDGLAVIAEGLNRIVQQNPHEVFLIEGHTDVVGTDVDNLFLSDRRAESVALVLTQQFGVPPENLSTQGYGKQYLKVPTEAPEQANRRVTVRRITPLLTGQGQWEPPPSPVQEKRRFQWRWQPSTRRFVLREGQNIRAVREPSGESQGTSLAPFRTLIDCR